MRNKIIAILGAAAILVGAIGGVAFARSNGKSFKANQAIKVVKTSPLTLQKNDVKIQGAVQKGKNGSSAPSKNIYQDMARLMRENGFGDAAGYMQTGNYAAMANYMNTLSQEDYDKMIDIMSSNGYGYMAQMMQSIGREGMIQMHNAMLGNGSNFNGMMGFRR